MPPNFALGGILFSPIVPMLLIALLSTVIVSLLLMRLGFYQLVWQRPLVELAIFCMIFGALAASVGSRS